MINIQKAVQGVVPAPLVFSNCHTNLLTNHARLDESLKRFGTVFPACGSNSAIELTIAELEQYSAYAAWVDVCKNWEGNICPER